MFRTPLENVPNSGQPDDKTEDPADDEEIGFQGLSDCLLSKVVPDNAITMTSYIANKALYHLMTDVLEITASVGLNWNATAIVLAQIKQKLDQLLKNVSTLLEADYKAALEWLKMVSNELEEEQYSTAFQKLQQVQKYSIRGYSQVNNFGKKVFCKKMAIYAERMIKTYRKENEMFVDESDLTENEQRALAKNVFDQLEPIVEEFEKIRDPNFFQRRFSGAKSKTEEQDVLDSLLKTTLPTIWDHINIFKESFCFDNHLLRYIPEGREDSCNIYLEKKWPITVWKFRQKDGKFKLDFEFQHEFAYEESITETKFESISSAICKQKYIYQN